MFGGDAMQHIKARGGYDWGIVVAAERKTFKTLANDYDDDNMSNGCDDGN